MGRRFLRHRVIRLQIYGMDGIHPFDASCEYRFHEFPHRRCEPKLRAVHDGHGIAIVEDKALHDP